LDDEVETEENEDEMLIAMEYFEGDPLFERE
jgi:hypothetical protein